MARSGASGFGLIELMVVVAILGLITAFGLPSFTTWGANSRARAAAEAFQNGLRLAQSEAVRRNETVRFRQTADTSPDAESEASPTGTNWVILAADDTVLHVKGAEAATGVSVVGDAPGAAADYLGEVGFSGLGRTDLGGGTLDLAVSATGDDLDLRVLLTAAGRVRMCDGNRTAGTPQACE